MSGGAGRRGVEAIVRLTPVQEGLLFHVTQDPDGAAYLHQCTALLCGPLDLEHLEEAWNHVVRRHDALRALFTWETRSQPLQVIRTSAPVPFTRSDDSTLLEDGESLRAWLAADRRQGLRLDKAPLMRVTVVRGEGVHRLLWTFHHLVLDGWSMRRVLDEVLDAEATLRQGGSLDATPSPSFRDYVRWVDQRDHSPARAWFTQALADVTEPTPLPLRASPQAAANRDDVEGLWTSTLTPEASDALRSLARKAGVTLNIVFRGVWALLLGRTADQYDVVFGATVSGRTPELPRVEERIGLFINTLPVRATLDDATPVIAWLKALQVAQLNAAAFEATPLTEIQAASDMPRGTALFDSIVVFENHPSPNETRPGKLSLDALQFHERSHYPLAVLIVPGDSIEVLFVYDGARFTRTEVARLAQRFCSIVGGLVAAADGLLGDVALGPPETCAPLVGKPLQPLPHATVVESIRAVAQRTPDAMAVRCGLASRTYAELIARASELAQRLRDHGAGPGTCVGLRMPRSCDQVVGLLGILASGSAYLPIALEAPEAHVSLALSHCVACVTTPSLANSDAPIRSVFIEDTTPDRPVPFDPPTADSLAYVLFTSGSTGTPKGVEVTHANLAASTAARLQTYGDTPRRFLLLSPVHFDSAVAGLFGTLSSGGTLVLPEPGVERDVVPLAALIRREGVTQTLCLPSLYALLLEHATEGDLATLESVLVAGEACPASLAVEHRRRMPGTSLWNEYGPTEATVWATAHEAHSGDAYGTLSIGRPIPGTTVHVLDRAGRPLPRGVAGELVVEGPGVARGYRNEAARTAERFVTLHDRPGAPRVYRTGDLVRITDDERLEFLGRRDHQVKIRGHRIELGDVEAHIAAHDDVRECIVLARPREPQGPLQLIAYVTPRSATSLAVATGSSTGDPRPAALDTWASSRLAAAARPSQFVILEEFPRTSTGKVDRHALPAPSQAATETTEPPATTAERTLHAMWCDALGRTSIGRRDDFYALGGDSLLSIRLLARAHQSGLVVSAAAFADDPTIAGMARAAHRTQHEHATPIVDADAPVPLTPIQWWFFARDLPERHHWNQAVLLHLPDDLTADGLDRALTALAARHDALRLTFRRDGDRWLQRVGPLAPISAIDVDLTHAANPDEEWATRATEIQRSIDLERGGLLRAARVRASDGTKLLLIVHHLAVDAISWDVLVDELTRLARDETLAPTDGSFAAWAHAMSALARSDTLHAQRLHWIQLAETKAHALPIDGDGARDVASTEDLEARLDGETTRALLEDVPPVYGTRILDALLTALTRVVTRWSGHDSVRLDLEGHGRDLPLPGLDLSRLVGWGTAVAPWSLRVDADAPFEEALPSIKEQLRTVPFAGAGFGLLRWMGDEATQRALAATPPADLLFNYLGRQEVPADGPFAPAPGGVGECRSPQGTMDVALELNAHVDEDGFVVRWTYHPTRHHRATVQRLATEFLDELTSLVEHCRDPNAGGVTPSDFPHANVDQSDLDKLKDLLGD